MIRAIISDVDGIIIGEKVGFNVPDPHVDVSSAMNTVRAKGIPVALCTAKQHYSIQNIIKLASLDNPHITDAGAVIIDPIDDIIVKRYILDKELAKEILQICLTNDIYVEFYTVDDYFIQKDQATDVTKKHAITLQREPKMVADLIAVSSEQEITKIMPIARDKEHQKIVAQVLEQFGDKVSISWAVHPIALPAQFGVITVLGSSKKEGAEAIVENLGISFDEVLGIGDSTSDWSFIKLCGYGATLSNGTEELKELLKSKGEGKYFISDGSVDENGILEILKYFDL